MSTSSPSSGVPTNLRVNDLPHPLGTSASVYFGWHLTHSEANQIQTKYQILVASTLKSLAADCGEMWNSGAMTSRAQNHVAYDGAPLVSNTTYFWQVRFWDRDDKVSEFSETAAFRVGLLTNADWAGATWIRRETDDADDYTYYRKQFELREASIERATLYVSSVHKFELVLNGALIGTGASYHYPQFQYYNTYDVTAQLLPNAKNVLAVFNHWFGAGQGRPASARGLILKVIVEYADGTSRVLGTDASWKQTRAECWLLGQPPRNDEGVGYVEKIDARKWIPNWYTLDFEDALWDAAIEIGAPPTQPWTGNLNADLTRIVQESIRPASISIIACGTYLVDLGKVYSGRPRIDFSGGEAGQIVTLCGGYALGVDGLIDPRMNQDTDMTSSVILSGAPFLFLPCEYLGMRYVQIENTPMPITRANFSFLARHTELDGARSSFESSHATLDAVWDLMKYSVTLGAQEQFIDTPTREKGGFLVDSMNESLAAMCAYGERPLTRRTLHEFLQSMEPYWSDPLDRGRMNAVYPNGDGARDIPDFTQAYLIWVWQYYVQTGDLTFLREHYQELKSIADYAHRYRNDKTGLIHQLRGGSGAYLHGIVDWPPSMRYGYDIETDARTVINCYAYADAEIISAIANALGELQDAQTYRARAKELKRAINTHLLQGVYTDGLKQNGTPSRHKSQQANAVPLALGIVPQDRRQAVLEHVKQSRMQSGMVTVYWLIRALGELEQGEHLSQMYTNREWDGWAKNLAQGATCTWESWDAHRGGNLSQSHPWGAIGLVGIQAYILGVKPLVPQYEHVQIKPLYFGDALTFARGKVPTERGDIFINWEKSESGFAITVDLPVNVEATVYVPRTAATSQSLLLDGEQVIATANGNYLVRDVGSGKHTLKTLGGAE